MFESGVKFVLAVETAIRLVLDIIGILKLFRTDQFVMDADLVCDIGGEIEFSSGERRADSREGDGVVSAGDLSGLGNDGTIDTARKSDRDRAKIAQTREKLIAFLSQFRWNRRHGVLVKTGVRVQFSQFERAIPMNGRTFSGFFAKESGRIRGLELEESLNSLCWQRLGKTFIL